MNIQDYAFTVLKMAFDDPNMMVINHLWTEGEVVHQADHDGRTIDRNDLRNIIELIEVRLDDTDNEMGWELISQCINDELMEQE